VKLILYILLFLVLFTTVNAKYGWYPLESKTKEFLYGVCFVDSLYGWAVGDDGLILHTKDGGKKWVVQEANVGSWLLSVHFIDRQHGWTVGDFGRVRHTTNGGDKWYIQQSLTFPEVLNAVYFTDKNNGWATGVKGIIHTSDGGENWHYQTSDTITATKSIFFINKDIGWACGANGTIVKTVDGGTNWFRQETGNLGIVYDVFFIDFSNGWAACRNEPKLLRTTNGGATWLPSQNQVSGFFKKIVFVDKNIGWAVGQGGIVKSTDAGKNWFVQIPDSRHNLWWASFTDKNIGWAVGGDGLILKTDNGGVKFDVDFSANILSGEASLSTTFTDLTIGEPTEWLWDFGDGGTHKTQNPIYIYQQPGLYTVKLTVSDSLDSESKTRENYINVINPNALIADFRADTSSGTLPLTVRFEDLSLGSPESWDWDFGDGGTHKTQNPVHVYQESGTFTVKLKISKQGEEDTEIKNNYIIVREPIGIDEKSLYDDYVKVSPVPASEFVNIELLANQYATSSITIIDQKGKLIKTFDNNYFSNENNLINWNFTDDSNNKVAEGIYYVIIKNNNIEKNIIKKIIYMR
jgi:PKD repeat protein